MDEDGQIKTEAIISSVGCFGNSFEDRYFKRQLDRYLDSQDSSRIDQRAEDIYRAKLESLPVAYRTTSMGTRMLNLDDVIGDVLYGASNDGVALACAVRDGNEADVGRLLIKLLTNKLREQAQDEAEDEA